MKKFLVTLISVCLTLTFSACDKNTTESDGKDVSQIKCTNCENELSANDNFCKNCGEKVDNDNSIDESNNKVTTSDDKSNNETTSSNNKSNELDVDKSDDETTVSNDKSSSSNSHTHKFGDATCTEPANVLYAI